MAEMGGSSGIFGDARTRAILLLTVSIMVIAVVVGLVVFRKRVESPTQSGAQVAGVPGNIQSIPGSLSPTPEYARLQETQNVQQADRALKKGTSALPTVIRSERIEGQGTIAGQGVDFETLSRLQQGGVLQQTQFGDNKGYTSFSRGPNSGTGYGILKTDLSHLNPEGIPRTAGLCLDQSVLALVLPQVFGKIDERYALSACELQSPTLLADAGARSVSVVPVVTTPSGVATGQALGSQRANGQLTGGQQANGGLVGDQQPDAQQAALNKLLAQQRAAIAAQTLRQNARQLQVDMTRQARQLLDEWKPVNQKYTEGDAKAKAGGVISGQSGVDAGASSGASLIKAGDVIFAVLDTAVNSDEPGPVLATVVQGRFKGAKLVGSLRLPPRGEKVILSFNTLSLPGQQKTKTIEAVAIDPNTARTALSSHTNHHYLLRYGSLFASSFLQGYGQAVSQAGSSISTNGTSTTVTQARLKGEDKAVVALGRVGQAWGNQIGKDFQRPPTVKVYAGVGLGILFTKDVLASR